MNVAAVRGVWFAACAASALCARVAAQELPNVEIPPDYKVFEAGIDFHKKKPEELITFNLEDADLADLIRLISQTTGRSFIVPSKPRSIKATVYAPMKVTTAEAYQAFLSILELNGMTVVSAVR